MSSGSQNGSRLKGEEKSNTDITVKRAVVHVVAPRRGVLHQSTAEIDLDEPVRDFLTAHVTQGLADGQAELQDHVHPTSLSASPRARGHDPLRCGAGMRRVTV